jgi:hypothetical protein
MVETSSPVYLIYLITPYIIVSYFLLYSIIHSRISGLIYIVGLIACILFTSFVGNGIENIVTSGITKPSNYICNSFSINGLFSGSQIPVSIAIYVFTLMYLLYTVIITSYILPNILPYLLFIPLILFDIYNQLHEHCFTRSKISITIILSGLMGVIWGYIINKSNIKSWQYLTANDSVSCTIPKRKNLKCKKVPIE